MGDFVANYWPYLLGFGVFTALFFLALTRLGPKPPPYEKRNSLLTKSELRFFGVLKSAGDDWVICSMVRIADLIRVRPQTPKRQAWQNRIHAKHIDFVLCDPDTMEVKLAIELDDRSHQRPDRIERDKFVNGAFAAAGLPLLRVPVQDDYDQDELRESIQEMVA